MRSKWQALERVKMPTLLLGMANILKARQRYWSSGGESTALTAVVLIAVALLTDRAQLMAARRRGAVSQL